MQTNNGRIEEAHWLLPLLRSVLARMTLDDVVARCSQANLPFSPIARPEDLITDPQLNASDSLIEVDLPSGQTAKLPRIPIRFNQPHDDALRQPPSLGADTYAILTELEYEPDQIEAYQRAGIIV